jgi:hypothetical protein
MLCSAIIHFLGIHVRPPPSPLASECEAVDDLPTPLTVLVSIMYPLNDALHTLSLGDATHAAESEGVAASIDCRGVTESQ